MRVVVGYDAEAAILAIGAAPPRLEFSEAISLLKGLLVDFRFATEADRSRALAAFITPALVLGGLLGGRGPPDLGEAEESQAAKGYRNKMTAGT